LPSASTPSTAPRSPPRAPDRIGRMRDVRRGGSTPGPPRFAFLLPPRCPANPPWKRRKRHQHSFLSSPGLDSGRQSAYRIGASSPAGYGLLGPPGLRSRGFFCPLSGSTGPDDGRLHAGRVHRGRVQPLSSDPEKHHAEDAEETREDAEDDFLRVLSLFLLLLRVTHSFSGSGISLHP
jgi:hypothetical protein